jgi:hypothetical protein
MIKLWWKIEVKKQFSVKPKTERTKIKHPALDEVHG